MSTSLQQRRRGNHDLEVGGACPIDNKDATTSSSPNTNMNRATRRRRRKRNRLILSLAGKLVSILATLCVILAFCSWRMSIVVQGNNEKAMEEALPAVHLPIPNVDIAVPNGTEWPLIHIVNTRFMQEQGALETLGMARLHLFFTFCFPTMINQSTQNVSCLWD